MTSPGSDDSMSLISSRLTSDILGLLQSFLTLSCLFGDTDFLLGLCAFGSVSDTLFSLSACVFVTTLLSESSSALKCVSSLNLEGFSLFSFTSLFSAIIGGLTLVISGDGETEGDLIMECASGEGGDTGLTV